MVYQSINQFSQQEKILYVEVGLGNIETVSKQDKTRKSPSGPGFDSIIVSDLPYKINYFVFLSSFYSENKKLIHSFYKSCRVLQWQ